MAGTLDDLIGTLTKLPDQDREFAFKEAKKARAGMLWVPNPGPQTDAYFSPADLLYYGGSAGGGKSQLLLGTAINEHMISRLFRRQFKDIDGEGGLVPELAAILGGYAGYRGDKHVWSVPGTKRKVEFGAFENDKESEAYQGRKADFFGFDEAVQFKEHLVRFITIWNRSTVPKQRCRTILASNPPVTPEGLWIIEWFAAWLDPQHPNPAEHGELRWFATVDGHEIEVDQDYTAIERDATGHEMEIRAKSRTFIPASLTDNPDLLDTGYASQLANLPKHLKDAMLGGVFKTSLEDADRQIIPTEWVIAAQSRWPLRKQDLIDKPMAAAGVDVADGGKDRMTGIALHGTTFGEPKIKPGADVGSLEAKVAFVVSLVKDDPQINVDCGGGYGGGLSDTLENNGFNVVRCKGAEASMAMDRDRTRYCANKRSEWVLRFKEGLDPERGDNIALPPGREIIAELTAFREKSHPDMRNTFAVEGNEEIVKRLGRSPDIAWSMFFAWAEPNAQRKQQRNSTKRKRPSAEHSPRVVRQYAKVTGRRR